MDKKWLLVAINAKYSHTSLSVRSISSYIKAHLDFKLPYAEFNINDEYFYILREIIKKDPDVIGFSCYIWNIELVKKLVPDIKSIKPQIKIFLGGPEVSYNKNVFSEIPQIDLVVKGEGEIPILKLLKGEKHIKGVWYKDKDTDFSDLADMEDIPFCYSYEELKELKNRAVYYETSRGCPFKCAFCISSLTKGVRTISLERVFKEIDIFISAGIKRVKLVDRTFNFDKERAKKIILYILENSENTCFHFEIGADLLDDELTEIIKNADKKVIQLEAGIQSTNETTLSLCDRKTDMEKLKGNLLSLSSGIIRVHVDLIAGLPNENYESFKKSFKEALMLKPTVLQVGFLKLLHGSKLREEKDKYDYRFLSRAPYEILSSNFISFFELAEIKKVDKSVDSYLNSGIFKNSLSYIIDNIKTDIFDFFKILGENMGNDSLSLKEKFYTLLYTYNNIEDENEEFEELLKLDYVLKQRGALPDFFKNFKNNITNRIFADIINNECIFPDMCNKKPAEIIKYTDYEILKDKEKFTILLINRNTGETAKRDICNISEINS